MPSLNSLNSGNPTENIYGNPEPSRMEQVVLGTLLGDGHIDKIGSLACEHSVKQTEYLYWKYNILKDICISEPKQTHKGVAIRFRTKALFKDLREAWYGTGRKALSDDFEGSVTPLVLAVWFMDDGDCMKSNRKGKNVDFYMENRMRLSIHSFNRKEARRISDVFDGYGVRTLIKREGKYLRLHIPASRKNSLRFADIIAPHMPECMHYKLPLRRPNMRGKFHGNHLYNKDARGRFKHSEGAETKQGGLGIHA